LTKAEKKEANDRIRSHDWLWNSRLVRFTSRNCCIVCRVGKMHNVNTASVAYLQTKNQLSGFAAYPDVSPSQLLRTSGVLLYLTHHRL